MRTRASERALASVPPRSAFAKRCGRTGQFAQQARTVNAPALHLPHVVCLTGAVEHQRDVIGEFLDQEALAVAVGIGDAAWEEQMRAALAMGADRALLVLDVGPTDHVFAHATLRSASSAEA